MTSSKMTVLDFSIFQLPCIFLATKSGKLARFKLHDCYCPGLFLPFS